MSTSPSPSAHLERMSLDNTLGALVIGEILTAVFYGITSIQIYIYCGKYQRDGKLLKRTMLFLWVIDTVHLALTSHSIYHYTVTNFMNPQELFFCPWSFAVDMIIMGLSDFIVSVIFVWRLWMLSGNAWLLCFILPLIFASFVGATAIGVLAHLFPPYLEFNERFAWLWYLTFSIQAFCDCTIAVSLCVVLIRQRTGFKRTDSLIRTLVLYSINTCALTSSVAVASVITYAVMPHNFIFIMLAMILPKLMLNSLLALLNSRESMRERVAGPVSIHISHLGGGSETPSESARLGKERVQLVDLAESSKQTNRSFDGQQSPV